MSRHEDHCSVDGCYQPGVDWLARTVDGLTVTIWLCRVHWIRMKTEHVGPPPAVQGER